MDDPSRASVRATYERIGEHFARTRANAWPEVEAFLEGADAPRALDVGCGNGRHAALLGAVADEVIALDASRALLGVAGERLAGTDATLLQGDAGRLPLADGSVDLAVYVATLHHLPTREARLASLDELARVLEPGGRALVTAWSSTHERFGADPDAETGMDTTVAWTLPGGETVDRFYHIYAPVEFERDLAASALDLADSYVSSGNCYAEVRA